MIFADGSHGIRAILKRQARHHNTLMFRRAAVVIEKEIKVPAVLIQHDGEVAVTAREESVLRAAIQGISGGEYDPKIGEGTPSIRRHQRSNFRCRKSVVGTYPTGFVVIPRIDRAVVIPPGGLDPDRIVIPGSHHWRRTLGKIEGVRAAHRQGISRRRIHVKDAVHP